MQKNLTSFFGKVAAVSPLVGSNEIRDLTAVNVSNCKEAALSSSIEAAAASSVTITTKQKENLQDNRNISIVTPSSSAENATRNNETEDSYSIEFDRLQDTSSSPQQLKTESQVVDLVKSDEIIIIDEPEDKNVPQIINQSTNKKPSVAERNKKPRAPKPRNTNPVKRKSSTQKDAALKGIAFSSPAPRIEESEVVAIDASPIIATMDLVEVGSCSLEPSERDASDNAAEEGKKESSGAPQPKKRKSKKPDMYADENYVKPKRVRNKKSEGAAIIIGSISETLTSPSSSSSTVKAPATNTITGFMTESTTTITIVPFTAEGVSTHPATKIPTLPAPVVVIPKPLPEYSPEILAKIMSFKEKALALCSEMAALEKCPDLHDNMVDVAAAQEDLVQFCKKASVAETATVVGTASADKVVKKDVELDAAAHSHPPVVEEEMVVVIEEANGEPVVEDKNVSSSVAVSSITTTALVVDTNTIEWKCKAVIARCMQGSPNKLSQSIPAVRASLTATLEALAGLPNDEERKSTGAETRVSQLLESEEKLSEFIKEVAGRESYGHRQRSAGATVAVNEDEDPMAIYRWEVHNSALYLSAPGQSAAKELRTVRKRYGKAVRAMYRVIEQLQSMRGVATETEANKGKVATLEDILAKSMAEIEKAKGRRLELLKKRALEAEEKARKEEAKEAKKREREEKLAAAVVAAQEKEKEKEKDKKKSSTAVVEKEKKPTVATSNPLLKFFMSGKDKPSVATTSSDGGRDVKAPSAVSSSSTSTAVDSSASSTSAVVNEAVVVDLFAEEELLEQRRKQFNDSIAGTLSMSEILLRNKEWLRQASQKHRISQAEWRAKTNKQPRRLTSITVSLTVSSNDFGGDDDHNYCEIRDVFVDNKIRTLSFCEDHRPAYVGTWSKRSRSITGRRPFGRDDELLNYDYDSEAEWEEEEDDGEDIMESDEEDKKEKGGEDSELEYDEMFCKDDDFGSDVDSDRGEIAAAVKNVVGVGHRIGEEVCGPKFLRVKADIGSSSSSGEECDRQRDMQIYFRPPHVSLIADSAEEDEVLDGYYKDVVKDSDVIKLSRFTAVVFAPPDAMPFLGDHKKNHIPRGGGSTKKKKRRAAKEDEAGKGEDSELNKDSTTEGKIATGKITESDVVALLHYVHGKKDGLEKLVVGFHELHPTVSKAGIKRKIQEAAQRQKREDGSCASKWIVNQEFLAKANLTNIELPVLEMTPLKKKKRKISECVAKELKGAADLTSTASAPLPPPSKKSHPFAQNPSVVIADTSSSAVSPPERSVDEMDLVAQPDKPSAAATIGAEAIEAAVISESNEVQVEIASKTGDELSPGNHPVPVVAAVVQPTSSQQHSSHRRVIDAARGKSKSKASPPAVKKAKTSVNCRKITDFASMKTKPSPDRVATTAVSVVVDLSGDTEDGDIDAAKALTSPSQPTPSDPLEAASGPDRADIILSDTYHAPDNAAAPAALTDSLESINIGYGTIAGDQP